MVFSSFSSIEIHSHHILMIIIIDFRNYREKMLVFSKIFFARIKWYSDILFLKEIIFAFVVSELFSSMYE